jgi:hypothetical protein
MDVNGISLIGNRNYQFRNMSSFKRDNRKWGRQWVGVFSGAAVAWALMAVFPSLQDRISFFSAILWGGAIGAAVVSIDSFEKAGAALTRRDNRALNLGVGLGIPIILLFILFLIFR